MRAWTEGDGDDLEEDFKTRDDFALEIGQWKLENMSEKAIKELAGVEWSNCVGDRQPHQPHPEPTVAPTAAAVAALTGTLSRQARHLACCFLHAQFGSLLASLLPSSFTHITRFSALCSSSKLSSHARVIYSTTTLQSTRSTQ